jgi:serine phosphatase RsbU (regulator of sigma subunit)
VTSTTLRAGADQHAVIDLDTPRRQPLTLTGLTCATRYLPPLDAVRASTGWYDAFALTGGAIGVAVGDVAGSDPAAGQLREVVRSCADEGSSPGVVLDRVERLLDGAACLATAIYARLVVDGGGGLLLFSNAGHAPPLVVPASGPVLRLDGAAGSPIGTSGAQPLRAAAAVALPKGSTLVLYSAGLVGSGQDPDAGITALARVIASVPAADPELLADTIVADRLTRGSRDDAALLVIRVDEGTAT